MGEMTKKPTVPAIRFKGFTDTWEQCELGAIIQAVQELTSDFENYPLYSLTIENGVTPKTERYERSFLITKETDLFKIVPEQCFVSNPMNLRFGAIGFNDSGKKVSVSGYYDVFSIDRGECSNFWCVYLKTANSLKRFDDVAIGSLIEKRRVHFSQLTEMSFPAPNMNEKKKLGEFFERLERLITLHQRKLDKLHKVKRSLLERMFPRNGANVPEIRFSGFTDAWEQRKFSDVVATRRGLTYKPSDIRKNGVRVLRSSNIAEDSFTLSNEDVFVVREAVNIDCARANDILITAANGSSRLVGKHTIISGIPEESAVHGGFMLLGTTKEPHFVNASMGSSWYRRFIELFVAGGNGAIGNLNKNDLDNQEIAIPSEEEQKKIGSFFRQLDNLITLHQRKLDKLRQIKRSMLEKMFV